MQALLVVDVQHDFLPGGALGVPDGDQVVPIINRLMPEFELVVATQDWHPADHQSFATHHLGRQPGDIIDLDGLQQILWPDHCVQHSAGAAFASALDVHRFDYVVRKGNNPLIDSYSAFFDNGHRQETELHRFLQSAGVTDLVVCGLATDYCVLFSVIDARDHGYTTTVVADATRAVNLSAGDYDAALTRMRAAGARVVRGDQVLN